MTTIFDSAKAIPEPARQGATGGRQLFSSYGIDEVCGEGYGRRALAKIIDVLLLNAVEFAAMAVFMVFFSAMGVARGIPTDVFVARLGVTTFGTVVLSTVAFISYFTIFEWMWGSTPGK